MSDLRYIYRPLLEVCHPQGIPALTLMYTGTNYHRFQNQVCSNFFTLGHLYMEIQILFIVAITGLTFIRQIIQQNHVSIF